MNKKIVCTLMVGTLLAGMLTGCGGSSEGGSSAKGSKGTEEQSWSFSLQRQKTKTFFRSWWTNLTRHMRT